MCSGRCSTKKACLDDPIACQADANPDCSEPGIALVCPRLCNIPKCELEASSGPLTCTDQHTSISSIWNALREWHCSPSALPPQTPPAPQYCIKGTHCGTNNFVTKPSGEECYCEPNCERSGDCCPDYQSVCRGVTTASVSTIAPATCAGQCDVRGRDIVGYSTGECACGGESFW